MSELLSDSDTVIYRAESYGREDSYLEVTPTSVIHRRGTRSNALLLDKIEGVSSRQSINVVPFSLFLLAGASLLGLAWSSLIFLGGGLQYIDVSPDFMIVSGVACLISVGGMITVGHRVYHRSWETPDEEVSVRVYGEGSGVGISMHEDDVSELFNAIMEARQDL